MQNAKFFLKSNFTAQTYNFPPKPRFSHQKPARWTPYAYQHIYEKSEWQFLIDSHKEEEETEEVDMEMK
jgi:hypothetical protein